MTIFCCQLYKEDRTATGFTLNRFFLSMHSYLYVFTGYNNTNTANWWCFISSWRNHRLNPISAWVTVVHNHAGWRMPVDFSPLPILKCSCGRYAFALLFGLNNPRFGCYLLPCPSASSVGSSPAFLLKDHPSLLYTQTRQNRSQKAFWDHHHIATFSLFWKKWFSVVCNGKSFQSCVPAK